MNNSMVNVKVTRGQLVDILLACDVIKGEMQNESSEFSDKWEVLHDTLVEQLKAFDKAEEEKEKQAKKKFKLIDNGYRCKKDYEGFGWRIEGNDGTSMHDHFDNWLIEVGPKEFEEMNETDDMMKIRLSGLRFFGFRNLSSAKKWAEQNAR